MIVVVVVVGVGLVVVVGVGPVVVVGVDNVDIPNRPKLLSSSVLQTILQSVDNDKKRGARSRYQRLGRVRKRRREPTRTFPSPQRRPRGPFPRPATIWYVMVRCRKRLGPNVVPRGKIRGLIEWERM